MNKIFTIKLIVVALLMYSCNTRKSEIPDGNQNLTQEKSSDTLKTESIKSTNDVANENADSLIVGTWISEDSNWKRVFKSDKKCYDYYQDTLQRTSSFKISNTSPQCKQDVPIEEYTNYIQLINLVDKDTICYEVNGLTNEILSITPIDRGRVMIFKRQ